MKKIFFSLLLLAGSLPALAQIEKGNVMLGGSVSGSWSRQQSTSSSTFSSSGWDASLSPNVGYFVVRGLALGAVTSYGINRSRIDGVFVLPNGTRYDNTFRGYNFTLGPALHYFVMLGDKLAFYAQTSLAWGKSGMTATLPAYGSGGTMTVSTQTSTNRSRMFTAGPGLAYFLNPHVALLGGVSYRNHRNKDSGNENAAATTNTTNGIYLNIGAQVFVGK